MSTALPVYLAMTHWEFHACAQPPQHIAWMACHFSPYAQGLSNIPEYLPAGSLLMVNDRTEPHMHDPSLIAHQLTEAVERLHPRGIVLDFQRPANRQTQEVTAKLLETLPCPVAVTPIYDAESAKAVFVPPVPPNQDIRDYLKPWEGKEIWLETEKAGICLTVNKTGCTTDATAALPPEPVFADDNLFCHYGIQVMNDRAVFSLYRTKEDQERLLEKAEKLGVTLAVGLYQEMGVILSETK